MSAMGRGIDRMFEGIRFRWSDGRYAKASGPSMGERMGERWRSMKGRWRDRMDNAKMEGWGTEAGGKGRTVLQVMAVVVLCGATAGITWYFTESGAGGVDPTTAKTLEALRVQAGERSPSLTGLPTLTPMSASKSEPGSKAEAGSGATASPGSDARKNEPAKPSTGVMPSLKPKGSG